MRNICLLRVVFICMKLTFTEYAGAIKDTSISDFGESLEESQHRVSLWNGRLIVSRSLEAEKRSKKACINSYGREGECVKYALCERYNKADLFNNVCFMDRFVPGICCEEKRKLDVTPIRRKTTSTKRKSSGGNQKKKTTEYWNYEECGVLTRPSSRIVGGDRVSIAKWPWMAAIFTSSYDGRKFHCGGSLISTKHVLTGAHCTKTPLNNDIRPTQLHVRLGDTDISTTSDTKYSSARFYRVLKITPHPKFFNINQYFLNDIAILTLRDSVVLSPYVAPICLPTVEMQEGPLEALAGKLATVIGYGKTKAKGKKSNKLMEGQVPIWKNSDCDNAYYSPIIKIFLCAGFPEGGVDACQGDSGGPLQIKKNQKWVQVGITSFGKGCGEPKYPGVYTRVSKYVGWLKENMGMS